MESGASMDMIRGRLIFLHCPMIVALLAELIRPNCFCPVSANKSISTFHRHCPVLSPPAAVPGRRGMCHCPVRPPVLGRGDLLRTQPPLFSFRLVETPWNQSKSDLAVLNIWKIS